MDLPESLSQLFQISFQNSVKSEKFQAKEKNKRLKFHPEKDKKRKHRKKKMYFVLVDKNLAPKNTKNDTLQKEWSWGKWTEWKCEVMCKKLPLILEKQMFGAIQ